MEFRKLVKKVMDNCDREKDALLIGLLEQKIKDHYNELCQDYELTPMLTNRNIVAGRRGAEMIVRNTFKEQIYKTREHISFEVNGLLYEKTVKFLENPEFKEILKCKALISKIKIELESRIPSKKYYF